jgi:hypothetical protein
MMNAGGQHMTKPNEQESAQLSVCHLGYRSDSPKTVTLVPRDRPDWPERIPFYIRQNCFRMPRDVEPVEGFSDRFPAPYDLLRGRLIPKPGTFFHQGELVRTETRWGVVWQGDFTAFRTPGSYQIETDMQVSAPFMIADWVYDRLTRGYLTFLEAQRCGCEIPGVHPACHLDDGMRDDTGTYWPAGGGWHDAGDFRKWLALTQGNLEALAIIAERGHTGFRARAREEIAWGNRLFHRVITEAGQVFEDVGGGAAPPGSNFNYDQHWWFENHPGCYGSASDNRWTDNRLHSGDERTVRTTYNTAVQFAFVQTQMACAAVLSGADAAHSRALAERAWRYGRARGHDNRTLFVTQELLAALALRAGDSPVVGEGDVVRLLEALLVRQAEHPDGLTGYFLEAGGAEAYRSITYAGLPAWALLAVLEQAPPECAALIGRVRDAVAHYCDGYLAADAASNPFALTPYGVYLHPVHPERQTYRDAGSGRGIRTFIHPFNSQGIVSGTGSVVMSHAAVLAKAGALLGRPDWRELAERQIQWTLGHNPLNRSLCNGIGYRQPVAYGFRVTQIPEGMVVGFIGRPDDTPYLEESFAIEWNTLEHWDVPYAWAMLAIHWIAKSVVSE